MNCRPTLSETTAEGPLLAVDARALGARLCVSLRTIRTMDAAGKLPRPVKLNGHSVRWVVSEIEEWLAAGAPDRAAWELIKEKK